MTADVAALQVFDDRVGHVKQAFQSVVVTLAHHVAGGHRSSSFDDFLQRGPMVRVMKASLFRGSNDMCCVEETVERIMSALVTRDGLKAQWQEQAVLRTLPLVKARSAIVVGLLWMRVFMWLQEANLPELPVSSLCKIV